MNNSPRARFLRNTLRSTATMVAPQLHRMARAPSRSLAIIGYVAFLEPAGATLAQRAAHLHQ